MKLRITAKNIKLTEAIKDFTQSKVDKLDKFFEDGRAEIVLTVDRKIYQRAEITIHARGKKFTAKAVEGDLYKAIDGAILKIEAQVRKSKGKYVSKKKIAKEDIAAFYGAAALSPENDVKFSVIKQVEVLPMNPEDAAYEMERLGYTFWMFLDEESKQINLIFKRLDGTYGLIQPVKAK
jgi:putative sigma-54 modulation protein